MTLVLLQDMIQVEWITYSSPSATVFPLCPHLVETDGLRIAANKNHIPSDQCQDSAVKVVGCRSHETLEFLSTCETVREHMRSGRPLDSYEVQYYGIPGNLPCAYLKIHPKVWANNLVWCSHVFCIDIVPPSFQPRYHELYGVTKREDEVYTLKINNKAISVSIDIITPFYTEAFKESVHPQKTFASPSKPLKDHSFSTKNFFK
ncbi:uncharacterized protein TNCT_292111 [Trichonephila clavata]|uniref:Uncharacterized protein n=1 Tax=Trichonephila clavata TaxID=2740835 RepID=A0A8X6LYL2_TRICU|nr:uncharacterized protein TNCT_292111 [Trichonephila clavata]